MEKKKSKKANLEKSRSLFLTIGLIMAMAALGFAFNWQSAKDVGIISSNEGSDAGITIPVTTPDPIKPEPIHTDKQKVLKDLIIMVDNNKPVDSIEVIVPTDIKDPVFIEVPPEPDDKIFVHTEQMPIFQGNLRNYIATHVVYPAVARENCIEGTVYVKFVVTETGEVGKVVILNESADKLLKDAAYNVIKNLPDFEPGMQNGEKVNVWLSVPISFKLN